jgi:hypothetical protein
MTEHGHEDVETVFGRDLQALRRHSERDLPSLADITDPLPAAASMGLANRAARPHSTLEAFFMQSRQFMRVRPWLTTAVATALVLGVLFVIPISFERTVGHDVTLAITQPAPLDGESLRKLAGELESALAAENVRVGVSQDGSATKTELVARVQSRSRTDVERSATAFASALTARGIPAAASIASRKERVSSNVYAMAMNQVVQLRIERAGRTPQEIEADIRAQLEAAGIENSQVSVREENGQTHIQVQAHAEKDGEKRDFEVKLEASGDDPLTPRFHEFRVERTPGMTDADVKAEIERQMREAGVQGTVTVENGQVRVQVEKRETRP